MPNYPSEWIDTIRQHFGDVGLIGINQNKTPLYNGQLPSDFRPTKDNLEYWLHNPQTAAFGFYLEANDLAVIDVDAPELYPLFQDIETYTTQTRSGGYHLYFKLNKPTEQRRRIAKYMGWDIDLLEKGRIDYGHGYSIIKDAPPLEIKEIDPFLTRLPKKTSPQTNDVEDFKRRIDIK
jgi:hypothetical protein